MAWYSFVLHEKWHPISDFQEIYPSNTMYAFSGTSEFTKQIYNLIPKEAD